MCLGGFYLRNKGFLSRKEGLLNFFTDLCLRFGIAFTLSGDNC